MGIANKIQFGSIDNLFGTTEEGTVLLKLTELHSFKGHPFKVIDDERMEDLVASIKERGVLNPITVRPCDNGYEIISGHRRTHACQLAGVSEIPAVVKELTDEEATIEMVDYNIQREELLPSEKAFAYKMKLEAIKRKAGRPKNNAQIEQNKTSVEQIAEDAGESRATVQRLIRLTELIPDLLEMVDDKKLPLNVGVELSYLPKEQQQIVIEQMELCGQSLSIATAKKMRELLEEDRFTEDNVSMLLQESTKPTTVSVKISSTAKALFPENYSKKDMTELIERLLTNYFTNEVEL